MKIFRFEAGGHQKPGVILRNEERIDVSSFIKDYDQNFFAGDSLFLLPDWVEHNAARCPTVDSTLRLAPCVASPSKIVCVGLNYARHAAEAVMEVPREPVIFLKAPSSLCGANDDLVIPRGSEKTDWEVELAVLSASAAAMFLNPKR